MHQVVHFGCYVFVHIEHMPFSTGKLAHYKNNLHLYKNSNGNCTNTQMCRENIAHSQHRLM